MEICMEKYPVFKQRIYKNPKGGIIPQLWCEKGSDIAGYMNTMVGSRVTPWGEINESGAKLLLECTGEKTIGEIIKHLYGEESDKAKDPILEYFRSISVRFNMEFLDSPSPQKVKSYGTFECYYPMRVVGEVTTRCNLYCQHCSASAGSGEDMRKEDLFRIVDMLSEEGTLNFDISGGEPFFRKDILDIVEKCCDAFYDVVIATNGTLIGREEAKNLAKFTNLSIIVSLDSHTPQFHDTFRGVEGAFDKALSGIRNCVSEGIYTRIAATFTKDNISHFEKIFHLAEELGVNGLNYDVVRNSGRGENLNISPKDDMTWIKVITDTVDEKFKNETKTVFSERLRKIYTSNCGAGTTMWTFSPTGNVRPCCVLHEKYLVCGNLLKEDFHRIFSRDPASILSKTRAPCKEICGDCTYVPYCEECLCNGVLMYRRIKDECKWGIKMKVGDWVTLT